MQLARFFAAPTNSQLQAKIDQSSNVLFYPEHCCLLLGPNKSKTSLAFFYAYNAAKSGHDVVFICSQRKIQSQLPLSYRGLKTDVKILEKIKMKYVDDSRTLCAYLANIHMLDKAPEFLVIDDISDFFSHSPVERRAESLVKTFALLKDATEICNSRVQQEKPDAITTLLVTDTIGEEANRQMHLIERWLPLVLSIKPTHGNFTFAVQSINKQSDPYDFSATYEVTPEAIVLKEYVIGNPPESTAAEHSSAYMNVHP